MRFDAIAGGWCSAAIALAANLFAAFAGSAFAQQTPAAPKTQQALISPSARCADPVARIVSVQGLVELREPRTATWQRAQLNDALCLYDNIRVGAHSRASVQYSADVTVQFDQNSFVALVEAKDKVSTWVQMWRGALHFITRSRRPFRVITPFVNASVEGTEVYIALAKDRADLTVFEGKLDVANDAGQVLLSSGESATVQGLEAITDDDQFRTLKAQAPQRVLIAKPRDAVQWALYYPPVIDVRPGENVHPNLKAATEQFRAGNTAEAFAELDRVPVDNWDAQYFIYRASLLLYVGREQEAQADLAQALQQDAKKSDALALQAIIAVVQSDKEQGLSLAQKAVAADPASAAAQIALSYAQQAIFKLEAALQSAEQAAKLHPNNALAYARIAELQLSQGDLDKALVAAKKATELNPNLARTQSILGFSYLTRIDTKNAKETFARAIQLDSADPLPHLGLGLAKIREGKLEEGRRDIEQAVILDPNNSLIRSYVGKAYYEEKRDELAGRQFEIAKQLDPKDPTPWFYDAILKQSDNRNIDSLTDLETSIQLNEGRRAYRSRLLLDQDLAARNIALAQEYRNTGFEQLAFSSAYDSLSIDPGSFSAHRLLANALVDRPRHEIARVSEFLQSQIWQPLSVAPIAPQLVDEQSSILQGAAPSAPGLNELYRLYVRNGVSLSATALAASNDTLSDQVLLSGIYGPISFSLGQFHYHTEGFQEGSEFRTDLYSAFFQAQPNPNSSVFVELRSTARKQGDLSLNFFPEAISQEVRQHRNLGRLGFRQSLTPNVGLVGVVTSLQAEDETDLPRRSPFFSSESSAHAVELQSLYRGSNWYWLVGGSDYRGRADVTLFGTTTDSISKASTAYTYFGWTPPNKTLDTEFGLAIERVNDPGFLAKPIDKVSPKFGIVLHVSPKTVVRAAAFRGLRRTLLAEQTIEPTQIAGFNQFFDDSNGSDTTRYGIGMEHRLGTGTFLGMEFTKRRIVTPQPFVDPIEFFVLREEAHRAYLYTNPRSNVSLTAEYYFERIRQDPLFFIGFLEAKTHRVPLGIEYGVPRFKSKIRFTATHYRQRGQFLQAGAFADGHSSFWLVDLAGSYRFPKRYGEISLEVRNLFNKHFQFQETDLVTPTAAKSRFLLLRFSLTL